MRIAVLLAGQFRGDDSMIELHKEKIGNYDTYVACLSKYLNQWNESKWNPVEIYTVPKVNFKDTLWAQHRSSCEADESGFWQYWNLKYLLKNVPDYDFYIKSRNDLLIESNLDINFESLRDDTYYYSERHFNGMWPHINDQFWIGSKKVVDVIARFVDEFYLAENSQHIGKSNEHMLKAWLGLHNIQIEKFSDFMYSKNHNGITQSSGDINTFFLEENL